ncbi:potassium channel family protein [Oricola thermophila]|uniref:Two pore domain potassium channel family protein n=1 Tax=Oricola thermophila TaxID=2742145 RepID=A0A6N1VE11_9HYPH|nr:potassium channel family protein [Oricola thermophila]QKV17277.1 two pore domain potassium channel family protein [Oricola thermophila]
MLANLVIGTLIISLTVVIHTFGLIWVTRGMNWLTGKVRLQAHRSRMLAMNSVVLGIFAVLTVEVWLWAAAYLVLDVFDSFETALYFSSSTFSTVGYGDVVTGEQWRLLAGLESVNGFLLIGWSTAYLVAASMRVGPFKAGEHF